MAGWEDGFSLLIDNTHGNDVSDGSANSEQVRAIGRQMQGLRPHAITFYEVPYPLSWEMPNFVAPFLPGDHLAGNPGTDGLIRSVIFSRFPISRSTKWLDRRQSRGLRQRSGCTRDLFDAESEVPILCQPLQAFTTHLKSGQDAASSARRAGEA